MFISLLFSNFIMFITSNLDVLYCNLIKFTKPVYVGKNNKS